MRPPAAEVDSLPVTPTAEEGTPVTGTVELSVRSRRFLVGRSGGLADKTAFVELAVHGDAGVDAATEARLRSAALALCPEQPLFGVAESDWPTGFLVGGGEAGIGPDRLGQWVVALAVGVQRWGRDPAGRGRVLRVEPERLTLALPWHRQQFFDQAIDVALAVVRRCLTGDGTPPLHLATHFGDAWNGILGNGLAPNTLRFVQAAQSRDMPFDILPSFAQIGWGENAERFDMAFTGRTGWLGNALARNKWKSKRTLAGQGIPTPRGWLLTNAEDAVRLATQNSAWPVVVKPVTEDLGRGVVTGIRDPETLRRAFAVAAKHGAVILEQHVAGDDHRLLVVGGRLLAAARRIPARVTGDGQSTVEQLVARINADPLRGNQRRSLLRTIEFDPEALECLGAEGLAPSSVLEAGRTVVLRRTANISSGASAEDVTDSVHPDNRALAERVARTVGLDIVGIDFITADITRSWREVGGAVLEVNGQPGFRPHWVSNPQRDINGEVLDVLFAGRPARIPTAAISGTNGKTTTAMMLHRIWTAAGKLTGVCTTAQLLIGDEVVSVDNLSGQPGGRMILNDPGVQAAVLEIPRKGLIIFGHPCDRYDVAALINVQDDHIGVDGIETLDEMAGLKAEVLERASAAIVVNAEDPRCMAMRARAGTDRHILVATEPEAVSVHRADGGEAVYCRTVDGRASIVLAAGSRENILMAADEIPATENGLLRFNVVNAMFAAALAWAQGIDLDTIRVGLRSFDNSVEHNPGRYNFIGGFEFTVLLDYGHNPDGVREVCRLARGLPVTGRRLLCASTVGNLDAGHFGAVASDLATGFEGFVVSCVPAAISRARSYGGEDPVATMLHASQARLLDAGVPAGAIRTEPDPARAIRATLDAARPGDLVVLLAKHQQALPVIEEFRRTRG